MTDAELIALAALVNASCTEIAAANQTRHARGESPAYDSFEDIYGDRSSEEITNELERREKARALVKQEAENPCCEVHPSTASACWKEVGHEGKHQSASRPDYATQLNEWETVPRPDPGDTPDVPF